MTDRRYSIDDQEYLMARNMRRLCKGAFGAMSDEEWDHRVLGTGGSYRGRMGNA